LSLVRATALAVLTLHVATMALHDGAQFVVMLPA
jgi:hypothetical protein